MGAEAKTVKHTQCQIEMINKAERQSIPWCGVSCDRQVRANASESISAPPASGPGQATTERKPFHNEEKRNLAKEKPQERGDGVRRNHVGREIPWVARL